jgi:SAM-dependent methyltransferase
MLAVAADIASGRTFLRQTIARSGEAANRAAFVAALLSSGLAHALAAATRSLEEIAACVGCPPARKDALAAWLALGIELKVLRGGEGGYGVRSRTVKALVKASNDSLAAMAQCVPIEEQIVVEALDRIRGDSTLSHDDRYSALVARLSRQLEPFALSRLESLIPQRGAFRIVDVGCGSAGYLKHLAEHNPALSGVGLERIPAVVEQARANVRDWQLDNRIRIVAGGVESLATEPTFDLALLNLVIHYTPAAERIALLRCVHALLGPGGLIFITNPVRRAGTGFELLQLWALLTEGCGPIPDSDEIEQSLRHAGFDAIRRAALIPGSGFVAFWGRKEA